MPYRSHHAISALIFLLWGAPGCWRDQERQARVPISPLTHRIADTAETDGTDGGFFNTADWAPAGLVEASAAGDVNGDGFDDILARNEADVSIASTTFSLYVGSTSGLIDAPSMTIDVGGVEGPFGIYDTRAGDLDGDGFDDVAIAASSDTASWIGEVFVYRGASDGLEATPAITISGDGAADGFGLDRGAVSSAGDVDGDGYGDLIVGAPGYGDGTGRAYLYSGSADGLSSEASSTLSGENVGDDFGYSVTGAGDINGDGYDDVVISAPDYDARRGQVYVYLGTPDGISSAATYVLPGDGPEGWANYEGGLVSGAGDVNGDGYGDFLVSTYLLADECTTDCVSSYTEVHYGSADPAADSGTTTQLLSGEYNDSFGFSLSGVGDMNGDGYDDILIGAPWSVELNYFGAAYLYLGAEAGIITSPADVLHGTYEDEFLGSSVSSLGDVNGDGYGDVLVEGNEPPAAYYGHAMEDSGADTDTASIEDTGKSTHGGGGCGCDGAGISPDGVESLLTALLGLVGMRRRRHTATRSGVDPAAPSS